MRVGANYLGDGKCEFILWAPLSNHVAAKIVKPEARIVPMTKGDDGYWTTVCDQVFPGSHYYFVLEENRELPDPASHYQPEGVHGPSCLVDHSSFDWQDGHWKSLALSSFILYELHVGTFTPDGTFGAIVPRLSDIRSLGINALDIMPVAQFPGERNWGYDGVYPYAVQNSYGGPEGLKRLVNECHLHGIAVCLDVVYNHLGPEGNYLASFGSYFTHKYETPWGDALNFDNAHSDGVREYFIGNALHWFEHYHVDALRLDAVHAIYDMSAHPFLQELAEAVDHFSKQHGRKFYLIAESDLDDARIIKPRELGGLGLDAQWCDDFHHALRTVLTGDTRGYYEDFGSIAHLTKTLREGFAYTGQYSKNRMRRHGNSTKECHGEQFVVFTQNHDQIGNRMLGERLSALAPFEAQKLAAGWVFLSPYIPMLFMGEEYGETAPFLYFVSHSDPDLIEAVRHGRKEEFKSFSWKGETPDSQSVDTFMSSKLNWEKRREGAHSVLLGFHRELIRLRRELPALANLDKDNIEVSGNEREKIVVVRRWVDERQPQVLMIYNFSSSPISVSAFLPAGRWNKLFDSADESWAGPGALLPQKIGDDVSEVAMRPLSFAVFQEAA